MITRIPGSARRDRMLRIPAPIRTARRRLPGHGDTKRIIIGGAPAWKLIASRSQARARSKGGIRAPPSGAVAPGGAVARLVFEPWLLSGASAFFRASVFGRLRAGSKVARVWPVPPVGGLAPVVAWSRPLGLCGRAFFEIGAGKARPPWRDSMEEKELIQAIDEAMEQIGRDPVIAVLLSWIQAGLYLEIFADLQDRIR